MTKTRPRTRTGLISDGKHHPYFPPDFTPRLVGGRQQTLPLRGGLQSLPPPDLAPCTFDGQLGCPFFAMISSCSCFRPRLRAQTPLSASMVEIAYFADSYWVIDSDRASATVSAKTAIRLSRQTLFR